MKSYKKNNNELSWGCEFVDDGKFGNQSDFKINYSNIIILPINLIEKTLDKKYIAEIIFKDKDYINELSYSINMNGIFEPGTLTYDNEKVRLSDGNHRFIAAKNLGLKNFPVTVVEVDKIKAGSVRLADLFPDILELLWQEK
jgi:hypothetical protein